MTDFTRRTLRTWAVAEAVYAIVVAGLVLCCIPWKTPVLNAGLLLFAALHGFAAPGMYRLRRWGYRLSLLGGILAFVVAVIACSGLFATWAYLRAIYGDFGRGASLAALLLAGLALQFLGLYPALKLRALLRRELRADLGTGPGMGRALLGLCVLPLLVAAAVSARYRLDRFPPVAEEGREQVVMHLEAALRGTGAARAVRPRRRPGGARAAAGHALARWRGRPPRHGHRPGPERGRPLGGPEARSRARRGSPLQPPNRSHRGGRTGLQRGDSRPRPVGQCRKGRTSTPGTP